MWKSCSYLPHYGSHIISDYNSLNEGYGGGGGGGGWEWGVRVGVEVSVCVCGGGGGGGGAGGGGGGVACVIAFIHANVIIFDPLHCPHMITFTGSGFRIT